MWRRLAKRLKLLVAVFALTFVVSALLYTFLALRTMGHFRPVPRRVKSTSVRLTDTMNDERHKRHTSDDVNSMQNIDGQETEMTASQYDVDNRGSSTGKFPRDFVSSHQASRQQMRHQLHLVLDDHSHAGRSSASATSGLATISSPSSDSRQRSLAQDYFRPVLNVTEKATLRRTFDAVTDALDAANVTYWIDSGTLLGSYRHHDFIPWDDDADLLLRSADQTRARQALDLLLPNYRVFVEKATTSHGGNGTHDTKELCWRIYASRSSSYVTTVASGSSSSSSYGYPYVDVLFYNENMTHVWAELVAWWPKMIWPKSAVFPLLRRPIGDRLVPTPCDVTGVLATEYGGDDPGDDSDDVGRRSLFRFAKWCQSPGGRHDARTRLNRVILPCHVLANEYPFVHRRQGKESDSVIESLVVNNRTVRTLTTIRKKCIF